MTDKQGLCPKQSGCQQLGPAPSNEHTMEGQVLVAKLQSSREVKLQVSSHTQLVVKEPLRKFSNVLLALIHSLRIPTHLRLKSFRCLSFSLRSKNKHLLDHPL